MTKDEKPEKDMMNKILADTLETFKDIDLPPETLVIVIGAALISITLLTIYEDVAKRMTETARAGAKENAEA
jgi:hypothetical protein